MLWVDKHRPKGLDKLDYHPELTQRLKSIAQSADIPHLLFYGPSGAGKKTRVMALLRELFGPGVEKVKIEYRKFKTPTGRPIELTTLGSSYHIEMNPSDAGNNDRYVVQEVIKEIAQYHPVVAGGSNSFLSSTSSSSSTSTAEAAGKQKKPGAANFKVVFLSDCDALTKEAQHGLRRTMERYVKTCRLILCCENLSKVIEPLRSRCLAIRVPAPAKEEVASIITSVTQKEHVSFQPDMAMAIATASGRNLRRALLMAEAQRVSESGSAVSDPKKIALPDYEMYIQELANKITTNQNPQTLMEARTYLYELLGNCIPATLIFKNLVKCLSARLEDDLKHDLVFWAAHYEHRMQKGDKDIYHLEAFIAKFMVLYRQYLVDMFS